jgi:hypothetical protein
VRELQQKADRLSGRLAIIRPGWLYSSPCAAKFILSDPSLSSAASLPITQPPSPSTQSKPQQQSSSKKPSPSTTTTPDDMNNRIPRLTVCPEPYLLLLSEKLTQTAVMFIWFELLNEFFYLLPREIDNHLYYNLSHNQIVEFANENPAVQAHLRLQEKKDALELAMEKLSFAVRTQQQQQR